MNPNLDDTRVSQIDPNRMSFSLRLTATIVSVVVSVVISVMATTWGMRSDIRDLATKADGRDKIIDERAASANRRFDDLAAQMGDLKNQLTDSRRQIQLLQYDVNDLSKAHKR